MNNILLLPIVAILTHGKVLADGGAVQLQKDTGDLVITVFTSPTPLAASWIDVSVLLQSKVGLDPVLDADVLLAFTDVASGVEFTVRATRENARNKLLYACPVRFSNPGRWRLTVTVERTGQRASVEGMLAVASARGSARYAVFLAFPPLAIVLFAVRERLLGRRSCR